MKPAALAPLLNPRSIALLGSTDWTDAVAAGAGKIGYRGAIWRVHPRRESTAQKTYYRSVEELPAVPDCAFLAMSAADAPAAARALAARGCGALVGFCSGFSEIGTAEGAALSEELRRAAGTLPYLGPNCYGMVNFFDRVALWPDQVVGDSPQRGVALICQSGTLALTLMFNDRSLPIGYLITIGNQERLAAEDLIEALCADTRVTAIGLYLEGIKDMARFAKAAQLARECRKPIAIIKSGRSAAAARTAHSHTGAMTGSDAVFDAFCQQAGIARCQTLAELCETLKLLHTGGPLAGRRVVVMGCSGGDMAMTADLSESLALEFPAFDADTTVALRALLGDRVTIANPFDIHTYTWFDHATTRRIFDHVFSSDVDALAFMLDCPPPGRADDSAFVPVIDEFIAAATNARPRAALLASLPETLNHAIRARCIAGGVVPLQGLDDGLKALQHGAATAAAWHQDFPLIEPPTHLSQPARLITERAAKMRLAGFGLSVPAAEIASVATAAAAAKALGFPVVIKISGDFAHKSDQGGVLLNIRSLAEAELAALKLGGLASELLIEKMVEGGVAEILVGVVSDPQFGQVLVLGGGGVQAELWKDSVRLLPPWSRGSIEAALRRLRCWPLLNGFRGQPPADIEALIAAVLAIGRYATAHRGTLLEMDVNPLIVCRRGLGATAVDALIRETDAGRPHRPMNTAIGRNA